MWDVRQAFKLSLSHLEDSNQCLCRDVLERDKEYFPYKLPASCFLEDRPYQNPCDYKNCLYRARLYKIVNLEYVLEKATIDEDFMVQSPKMPPTLKKRVKVYLCLYHFCANYKHCCKKCAGERGSGKETWENVIE